MGAVASCASEAQPPHLGLSSQAAPHSLEDDEHMPAAPPCFTVHPTQQHNTNAASSHSRQLPPRPTHKCGRSALYCVVPPRTAQQYNSTIKPLPRLTPLADDERGPAVLAQLHHVQEVLLLLLPQGLKLLHAADVHLRSRQQLGPRWLALDTRLVSCGDRRMCGRAESELLHADVNLQGCMFY